MTLRPKGLLAVVLLALAAGPPTIAAQAPLYDVVIRNGRVLDGAGNPWVLADVAIRSGRIVRGTGRGVNGVVFRLSRSWATPTPVNRLCSMRCLARMY